MTQMIKIKKLSKHYIQDKKVVHALKNIELNIDRGDVFGIIGQSGAGKSTLIRCLARLLKPSSGHILFHDQDIATLEGRSLRNFRKHIGMIFQHFNLLSSQTVAGNVAYPLEIAGIPQSEQKKRIEELLNLVALTDKKHAYPSKLSGGEKQRVGIARALATRPDVLLCDEATSALDPKTTRDILNLLKMIHKELGVTIILITHEMEVIRRICNKIAVIEKGEIVEQGLVSEVFADPMHQTTKNFLQGSTHEIPTEFFKPASDRRKLLRLRFKGKSAQEPLISHLVRKFNVDANILLGWIDHLQTLVIGTLVIELTGTPEGVSAALHFLKENTVQCEVLENDQ